MNKFDKVQGVRCLLNEYFISMRERKEDTHAYFRTTISMLHGI